MRHLLRRITLTCPVRLQAFSSVARRLGPPSDGINLAKIGVVSCTLGSAIYIYATFRQLVHIDSSEYRPPAEWSSPVDKKTSLYSPLDKAKHQLRFEIIQEGAEWMIGCGLLLGGYNRLWRMSSHTARVLTQGPEMFRGRFLSNGLFAASTLALFAMTELTSSRVYQAITGVPVRDELTSIKETFASAGSAVRALHGTNDLEKLEVAQKWPEWKNWSLVGAAGTVLVGIPLFGSIAIYERLGPKAVKPMTKALVVAAGCTGVAMYLSFGPDRRPSQDTSIYYGQCTDLVEWSKHTETKVDSAELGSRIKAMLGTGPELKLVVMPDRSEKVHGAELRELLQLLLLPMIQEHPGYLYSDGLHKRSGHRYLCLWPQHLKNFDLDVNLALIADALTEDMKPDPWQNTKFGVFSAVSLAAVSGIMHLFYAKNPAVLLSIFPSLQAQATRHIPLMISFSSTSGLSAWLGPILWLWSYTCKRQVFDRDSAIAEYGPEVAQGWQRLLQLRGTAWQKMDGGAVVVPDFGSTDPVYAFVRTDEAAVTERVLVLDKLLDEPFTPEVLV